MLIKESYHDVSTSYGTKLRIHVYSPHVPQYPNAKFPAVLVFSEIYQVTGPVARFARLIAGQGFIVAAPSVYHNFVSPEPLAYDGPGTDAGNAYKAQKPLASYDEDLDLTVALLQSLPNFKSGSRIGATGMCLGGHLALRAAFHKDIEAYVSFFGTDIHSSTLGTVVDTPASAATEAPSSTTRPPAHHTLDRIRAGELPTSTEGLLIFGTLDPHVPPAGRDIIRASLRDANATFSFYEVAGAQHAFVRDEFSKGRYDPAVTGIGFTILLELFNRVLKLDLGAPLVEQVPVDHVC